MPAGWFGACSGATSIGERDDWLYVGDSTNDQQMFGHFPLSIGVANLHRFAAQLHTWPTYITAGERGAGFAQVVQRVLGARARAVNLPAGPTA